MSDVTDNPAQHRFEMAIDGSDDQIAAAYYQLQDNQFTLTHTEVPQEYSGQGIGSRLARGVFDLIRARGGKAVLRCSFMGSYYARHLEYADIVDG